MNASFPNILLDYDSADRKGAQSKMGWTVTLLVLASLSIVGLGGYILYKYRLRVCSKPCSRYTYFPVWMNLQLYRVNLVILSSTIWHRYLCSPVGIVCMGCSHTWIPRFERSWRNTCRWIVKAKSRITLRMMYEHDIQLLMDFLLIRSCHNMICSSRRQLLYWTDLRI